jgi:hypothetical protein
MAAISRVYTVGLVAEMLGEDEDWLDEISIEIPPEDGRLIVWQADGSSVTAFTEFGIENLRYVIEAHDEFPDTEPQRPSKRR